MESGCVRISDGGVFGSKIRADITVFDKTETGIVKRGKTVEKAWK